MTRNIKGTEHDFSVGPAEWEAAVFRNAEHFVVFRRHSRFQRERKEFTDFREAHAFAQAHGELTQGLLYAVTETGRSVMVPPAIWPDCLKMWKDGKPSTEQTDVPAAQWDRPWKPKTIGRPLTKRKPKK